MVISSLIHFIMQHFFVEKKIEAFIIIHKHGIKNYKGIANSNITVQIYKGDMLIELMIDCTLFGEEGTKIGMICYKQFNGRWLPLQVSQAATNPQHLGS